MPGLGALMSVGTQFSLKKAAGAVVRGLETALEGALSLDEEEGRNQRGVKGRDRGMKERKGELNEREEQVQAGQVSSRAENGTLLRRRSVKAAGESKAKKA